MNWRKKYGPTYPSDDDIYMSIFDEAMERIITSEVEPSSIELALYVISRLGARSQGSGASQGVGRHTVSYGEEPADHSPISREEGPKGGRCVAALVGAAALTASERPTQCAIFIA